MKKQLKLLIASVAIAASIIGYSSCNKKQMMDNSNPVLSKMAAKYNFGNFPSLEDGMLCFKDDDHYNSYLDFLSNSIDGIDSTDTVNDDHSILGSIEDGLSFTSLRKITHNFYEKQNEIGWPSLDAIPDEHFIAAADIRSTLNSNNEVKIGNEILHYINANCAVRVLADRRDLLDQYRKMPEAIALSDIWAVDPGQSATTFSELKGDGRVFQRRLGEKPTGAADVTVYYSVPDLCNYPSNVLFENMDYRFDRKSKEAFIKIDFGDGSPIVNKISGEPHLGFYRVPSFTHLYPNVVPHIYTMTVTASDDPIFPGDRTVTKTFPIEIKEFRDCARGFRNSGWQYSAAGDNEYIGGKLDMEKYQTNTFKLRVVAYSKLVKETSPGVFKGFKAEIYTDLEGDARRDDCSVDHHVSGSGWDSKAKFQTVHRTPDWDKYTEFVSNHIYIKKGQHFLKKIVMHPCN